MKKIFTLVAAAFMAVSVNAQTTLFDFENGSTDYVLGGSSALSTVKIHSNSDEVACLKFSNSYLSSGVIGENIITISGDFKKGDVITIAGAINNADETKYGAVVIFTGEVGDEPNVLHTTENFINGRLVDNDPVEETYTLEADASTLGFGRSGNTGTNITTLKIVRPATTGVSAVVVESEDSDAPVYNLSGQKTTKDAKGILIQNGKKFVNK